MNRSLMFILSPLQSTLSTLNEAQQRAVRTVDGPLLIFAGAGSGKTRTLTHRIAYLMHERGVKPWNILAVTFTNKAALEMKHRLHSLLTEHNSRDLNFENNSSMQLGSDPLSNIERHFHTLPLVGTFHSLCVRILRRDIEKLGRKRDFVIYDTIDSQSVMRQIIKDLGIDEKQFHYKAVLAQISQAKNELLSHQDYAATRVHNTYTRTIASLFAEYEKRLFESNALDFDALIFLTVRLFQEFTEVLDYYQDRYTHISVDEYQDTNFAQYQLIKLMSEKYRNLCVIGDNDQSIYSFRGADMRNILDFERDNPDATVIKLEQNYRSSKNIIQAADTVIAKNKDRPEKSMWTENPAGEKIQLIQLQDEREEADFIARQIQAQVQEGEGVRYADFVLLYRTNAQSRMLEEALVRHAIPYRVIGGLKFYARREIKDILAYLHVIKNPYDLVAIQRIINVPSRKIGQKSLDHLQQFAESQHINFWETLQRVGEVSGLSANARLKIAEFVNLIQHFRDLAQTLTVADLIEKLLRQSGYYEWLMDGTEEAKVRYENILELISVAQKYSGLEPWDSLSYFLEEVALVADADSIEEDANSVLLMTLHTAKGLEFPYVFIAGCEENIFPHVRSQLDEVQLEEERRLMYVGMTRAQKKLHLLYTCRRMLFGNVQINHPSRFLFDIPEELVESNAARSLPESDTFDFPDFHQADSSSVSKPTPKKPQIDYAPGDRVYHPVFGEGEIQEKSGDILEIKFDSVRVGVRRFAANIAPLRKLS